MSSFPDRRKVAATYFDKHYETVGVDFTPHLDAARTPLLEGLIAYIENMGSEVVYSFEGGAGPGYQALLQAIAGFNVTVNEYSPTAIEVIKQNLVKHNEQLPLENQVSFQQIIEGDLLAALETAQDSSLHAAHLNAVLHFFSPEERVAVYTELWRVLQPGGVVAISFKSDKDTLVNKGSSITQVNGGFEVEDELYTQGVIRLFVTDPQALVSEFSQVGFEIIGEPISWSVDKYNRDTDKESDFVGFLIKKPIAE